MSSGRCEEIWNDDGQLGISISESATEWKASFPIIGQQKDIQHTLNARQHFRLTLLRVKYHLVSDHILRNKSR